MVEEASLVAVARHGATKYLSEQLDLLRQLCSIDSGTGNVAGNQQVIQLIKPYLVKLGAEVEEIVVEGLGTHLVAKVRPMNQSTEGKVILSAHLDTVFGEGLAAQYPFHTDEVFAHGLGVGDCKAGVLISLFGALILKEQDLLPNVELCFIFTCDEEIGSASGQQVYAREAGNTDLALVFEGARKEGDKSLFVSSRKGVIVGSIEVKGREAHAGAAYLDGRSAVQELAHQIVRFYSFNDFEQGIYYNVSPISGGRPNGVVAGNARGDFCVAGIRYNTQFAEIERQLMSLTEQVTVPDCQVSVSYHTLFPAMEPGTQNTSAYQRVAQAAQALGMQTAEIGDDCATDAAYISIHGVPTIDALSAEEFDIHTLQEKIRISSIEERTALCAVVLGQLATLKVS